MKIKINIEGPGSVESQVILEPRKVIQVKHIDGEEAPRMFSFDMSCIPKGAKIVSATLSFMPMGVCNGFHSYQ